MDRTFWGLQASGILLQRESDGKVCLFHRHGTMNSGTWGVNGGKIDRGESAKESAIREVEEEACGGKSLPKGRFTGRTFVFKTALDDSDYIRGDDPSSPDENRYAEDGEEFRYTTFHYLVSDDKWEPKLNWEHDKWQWFDLANLPTNTVTLEDEKGQPVKPVDMMLKKLPMKSIKAKVAKPIEESFAGYVCKK